MRIPSEWTFQSEEIAAGFDQHVREQLPWYDMLTDSVAHIARHYIADASVVYDLGCSTGNIGETLSETLRSRSAKLIGVDESVEMRSRYRAPGEFLCEKLETFSPEPFSVAICFLVLMFMGKRSRRDLLERLKAAADPGGAVIIVDKLDPRGGSFGTALSRLSLAAKLSAGISPEEILQKELSLAGVQRPMTRDEIIGEQFFMFGDFIGTVWVNE